MYAGGGSEGEFRRKTVPVDSFEANPWGLYNVHGNIFEWIEDCWNTGGCEVRGGSWINPPKYLRSAFRGYWETSGVRYSLLGFRVGRTLTP